MPGYPGKGGEHGLPGNTSQTKGLQGQPGAEGLSGQKGMPGPTGLPGIQGFFGLSGSGVNFCPNTVIHLHSFLQVVCGFEVVCGQYYLQYPRGRKVHLVLMEQKELLELRGSKVIMKC